MNEILKYVTKSIIHTHTHIYERDGGKAFHLHILNKLLKYREFSKNHEMIKTFKF